MSSEHALLLWLLAKSFPYKRLAADVSLLSNDRHATHKKVGNQALYIGAQPINIRSTWGFLFRLLWKKKLLHLSDKRRTPTGATCAQLHLVIPKLWWSDNVWTWASTNSPWASCRFPDYLLLTDSWLFILVWEIYVVYRSSFVCLSLDMFHAKFPPPFRSFVRVITINKFTLCFSIILYDFQSNFS